MISGQFLYKKDVNKSVLNDGFGIDREYLCLFTDIVGTLKRGERRKINLIFCNSTYEVELYNINNPANKRLNDAYQIRYKPGGNFSQEMKKIFYKTDNMIKEQREIAEATGSKKRIFTSIPVENREYIAFYTTDKKDTFLCESILSGDLSEYKQEVENQSEKDYETKLDIEIKDNNASIEVKPTIQKIRKLNRKIGESLKIHYQYRCQICGKVIGIEYGCHVVEAHHIEYFVHSLNNNISNILIVCPNHHTIIHDKNPKFDPKTCIYTYPNGYKEGLIINDHIF